MQRGRCGGHVFPTMDNLNSHEGVLRFDASLEDNPFADVVSSTPGQEENSNEEQEAGTTEELSEALETMHVQEEEEEEKAPPPSASTNKDSFAEQDSQVFFMAKLYRKRGEAVNARSMY